MDVELQHLIREHYPFPIAHAHKKTLAFLDDDAHKLKCLIQAAESAVPAESRAATPGARPSTR